MIPSGCRVHLPVASPTSTAFPKRLEWVGRSRRNVVSETLAAAGVVENCEPKVQGAVGKPFFGFSIAPSVFHNAFSRRNLRYAVAADTGAH